VLHDELTGLPNRILFWENLSHRLKVVGRRKTGFAVLFLDVDDFKVVNDTLGHAAGDQLLVDVASRLRAALRAGDTAARVGGDEFVVLFDDVATTEAALVVAERLNEALRASYEIGPDRRIVTASIGIAVGPDGLGTADDVVSAADAAMYDAKRQGGGRCVLYREDLHGRRGR
jgi:diguanylate cyclase (GGDEF)-like protein